MVEESRKSSLPPQTLLLDIEEQLSAIAKGQEHADMVRTMVLQKMDKVIESTSQIPNVLYRLEQAEKTLLEHHNRLLANTEFRIRMETTVTARRTIFAVIATMCGGLGGALLAWILGKPH